MWEARHGFPEPQRTRRGHRRYALREAERVRRVREDRQAGMSLALAIRRVREDAEPRDASVFAELRRLQPDLEPRILSKRAMLAVSQAIEDECLAQAERPLLYAAFQRRQFYAPVARRWRELARTAYASYVFADFERMRRPGPGPVQVPLTPASPMMREWLLACWDQRYVACLIGWERPQGAAVEDEARSFEAVWSMAPDVVRQVVLACTRRLGLVDPDLAAGTAAWLDGQPGPPAAGQLRTASALIGRMAAYLGEAP